MTNPIKIKRSSVANKIPQPGDLDYGELAINYTDGNLFFKNSNNTVQTISSTQFVSVTGNITGGNILTAGNVTGNYFIGDGSQLTGIAQSTALLGDGGGMGQINHPVTSTGDAGTVTAAATDTQDLGSITQSPIPVQYVARDVDILSVVSVTGNITVGNILTNGYYYANGTPFAGGGGGGGNLDFGTFTVPAGFTLDLGSF